MYMPYSLMAYGVLTTIQNDGTNGVARFMATMV